MTPISPAHSLITGFCLILYPRGVTSLTSTPSRQHPEQQAAEITSGLWILPNSPAFVHVRTLGTQVEMSAHRKLMCVARTRRYTSELQTSVQLEGRYMNTVLSQAPGHLFLLMSLALNVKP